MPEGFEVLSVVPTAMLIFGGVIGAIVILVFAAVIIRGLGQWSGNNASPIVTTAARVVTKRSEVHEGIGESRARMAYFATFETSSGERRELALPGREFGLIADGDTGQLTYQGTRFQGFARSSISSH